MKTWTTKNGDELRIEDMTTEHILNCIKSIERNKKAFILDGNDKWWSEDPSIELVKNPVYTALIEQLNKRRN